MLSDGEDAVKLSFLRRKIEHNGSYMRQGTYECILRLLLFVQSIAGKRLVFGNVFVHATQIT